MSRHGQAGPRQGVGARGTLLRYGGPGPRYDRAKACDKAAEVPRHCHARAPERACVHRLAKAVHLVHPACFLTQYWF